MSWWFRNNRTPHLQKAKYRVVNERWQVEECFTDQCFDQCLFFSHSWRNSCLFFLEAHFLAMAWRWLLILSHYSHCSSHSLFLPCHHDCLAHLFIIKRLSLPIFDLPQEFDLEVCLFKKMLHPTTQQCHLNTACAKQRILLIVTCKPRKWRSQRVLKN